jgi:HD-GYP domain-containing protein (c-di-GMP phosphodiesterase class II)
LADALDAMLSDRPYRPTRSFKAVLEEVARCAGTQFDPDVVAAFSAVAEEKDRDYFKNSAATVDRMMRVNGISDVNNGVRYFLKGSMVADLAS